MATPSKPKKTPARHTKKPKTATAAPEPLRTEKPSQERRDQQRMLERTAAEESWITRLLRSAWHAAGRPWPGHRRGSAESSTEENRRR